MYQVLFVDDETSSLLMIQSLINWSALGFNISGTAINGSDALEYYRENTVDAVITDLQMPVMDGVTLINSLRESGFSGPILVLSNYSDYNLVRGALTAGAYDYLLKIDITKESLEQAVIKMNALLREKDPVPQGAVEPQIDVQDRSAYLYNLLLDPHAEAAGEYKNKIHFPSIACSIVIRARKFDSSAISGFISTSLSQIFDHQHGIDCIAMQENEYLVLIAGSELSEQTIERKLSVLNRQISTFLAVPAYISYIKIAACIQDLQKFFFLCRHGSLCSFYSSTTGILQVNLNDSSDEFREQLESTCTSVLSSLRNQQLDTSLSAIRNIVNFCSKTTYDPVKLKNSLVILVWCYHELGLVTASDSEIHKFSDAVLQSPNTTALLEYFSDLLTKSTQSFEFEKDSSIHPEIAKALMYIHKNFGLKITLEDVAAHIGLSKEYACRLFLKETGINMFKYLLDVRMSRAAELIENDESLRIKDIANIVGFDNQYFFSTKFKEYYGISPHDFRRKKMAENK